MSTFNYNTQNLGDTVSANTSATPAVDSGGYLAIQNGVDPNLYPSVEVTNIANDLSGLMNSAAINAANTVTGTVQVNPSGSATITVPISVNVLASSQGDGTSASVSLGFQYYSLIDGSNILDSIGPNTSLFYANNAGNIDVVQLGSNFMTVDQVVQAYASLPSNAFTDPSYWTSGQATTQQMQLYNYYNLIYSSINGIPTTNASLPDTTFGQATSSEIPPSNILSFFNALNQAPFFAQYAVNNDNQFTSSQYFPNGVNANNVGQLNGQPNQVGGFTLSPQVLGMGVGFFQAIQLTNVLENSSSPTLTNLFADYIGNVGGGFTSTTAGGTQQQASTTQIFNTVDQSFFANVPANITNNPQTIAAFVQDYANYFTIPSSAVDSTFNANGLSIPINFVNGSTVLNVGSGTLSGVVDPTQKVAPIASSSITSSVLATMTSSLNSSFFSAFDQAFTSSGAAANPVLQAEGEQTIYTNTLAAFMTEVNSGAIPVTSLQDMVNQWSAFVGPSVTLGPSGILSYQQIYNTFFPNGSQTNFMNLLNAFVSQFTQSSSGVFNSSMMADQWYAAVQNSYLLSNNLTVNNSQPLLESNFSEVKIIFSLYSLLINVLGDIQKLTAAQANYDNFLVKLENAYTNEIAGIPDNLIGSEIPSGVDLTTSLSSQQLQVQSSWESQLSNATQKWISNITSYNTEVSNQEKNQSTTISQSNEASNQQANLISSILQELQSLLQSIWR